MSAHPSLLPTTFPEHLARRFSGATSRQLRYWDQVGLVRPSVQRPAGRAGVVAIYTLGEVHLLRAIVLALADGRPLGHIRSGQVKINPYLERVQREGLSAPHAMRPVAAPPPDPKPASLDREREARQLALTRLQLLHRDEFRELVREALEETANRGRATVPAGRR